MRRLCLKILTFFIIFIFLQFEILPWMTSNELLPVWGDIIVMSALLVLALAFIEKLIGKWRKNEIIE